MDQKSKNPLSAEELAAVDKAMAEFCNASWKQEMVAPKKSKKSSAHKPVFRFSPLVRTILIAAIPVILAVTVLVFVFGSSTEEPSPTTPETTQPSYIEEPSTDGTEQPTEFPTPPDTQPIEPTESAPPYVPPTEPPTEPIPDPPVDLPEGTPLSSEDLAYLQELFHPKSVYAFVSSAYFTDPTTLKFQTMIAANAPYTLSDAERAYLGSIDDDLLGYDIYSIPRSDAIWILDQYYGLTLDDVPSAKSAAYWDQTDRYYFVAEAGGAKLTVTHGVTLPNGNIWVSYIIEHTGDTCTMVLSQAWEYHILANFNTSTYLQPQWEIKNAYFDQYVKDNNYTAQDLRIRYYGFYEGTYICFVDGMFGYLDVMEEEILSGLPFRYSSTQRLMVYTDGKILQLKDAYEEGWLSEIALKQLLEYYKLVHPYLYKE